MLTKENINGIIEERSIELLQKSKTDIYVQTDRLFVGLMAFEWVFGIGTALFISPRTWLGSVSTVHIHVWAAVFLGGTIAIFPILLGILRPGKLYTRYTIAVSQMLYSALLIHLMGGRIEAHFSVFGSLAFLAFYRDWKVLIPATAVIAFDHYFRGIYWPQSVFGVLTASPYRWMEHAAWVVFEDIFLIRSCIKSSLEMKRIAQATAELEFKNKQLAFREAQLIEFNDSLDRMVRERTVKLNDALEELKSAQNLLIGSEKLASIGQLAAGVAHEINNPIGYISNNMSILKEYIANYTKILRAMEAIKQQVSNGNLEGAKENVAGLMKLEKEVDLDYMNNDIDKLLMHSEKGLERICKIVLDLRTFAREENSENMVLIKIEDVIESILTIVQSELKHKGELKVQYGETPLIRGNNQRLGQVFINLLVNAAQSIKEKGKISLRTYTNQHYVCVDVADTGQGIPEENLFKIFDPFFTTKPVGQGTGLGLSVSSEIMKKHGGKIRVSSKIGEGSTFTVMLPMNKKEDI